MNSVDFGAAFAAIAKQKMLTRAHPFFRLISNQLATGINLTLLRSR